MTQSKEEILKNSIKKSMEARGDKWSEEDFEGNDWDVIKAPLIEAMQIYSDQQNAALLEEVERLKMALQEVANPIPFMQKEAEKQGNRINGIMANQIANDPNYLKQIAEKALNKTP